MKTSRAHHRRAATAKRKGKLILGTSRRLRIASLACLECTSQVVHVRDFLREAVVSTRDGVREDNHPFLLYLPTPRRHHRP